MVPVLTPRACAPMLILPAGAATEPERPSKTVPNLSTRKL